MKVKVKVGLGLYESIYFDDRFVMSIVIYIPQKKLFGTKNRKLTLNKTLISDKEYETYKGFYKDILSFIQENNNEALIEIAKEEVYKYFEGVKNDNETDRMLLDIKNKLKDKGLLEFKLEIKE